MADAPTIAYTDGACAGNPGPGGWAWAVPDGPFASGAEAHSTNQRMELTAALEAVRANPGRLEVVSDSTYVVNCFRDGWWEGWLRRGWVNSKKEPVANRDLWEPLVELVRSRGDVTFRWVKGHGGDPMNDLVDRLAVEAAATQQGRSGTGTPEDLGPADAPPGRAAGGRGAGGRSVGARSVPAGPGVAGRDPRLPAGRLVLVAGLRPTELGGYDDNPVAAAARDRMGEALAALRDLHGTVTVVSGLRLGAEQLGVEAAVELGIDHVAVLPYPDPDSVWPPASRARFAALRDAAVAVVELERRAPASKQAAGAAMARRDAWLAGQVDDAVVVTDDHDDLVLRLLGLLDRHLDDGQVLLLHP